VDKWECTICGYVYDPDVGDPDNGVKPGTPFDDLPDNWVCPVCGAGKDQFVKKSWILSPVRKLNTLTPHQIHHR